MKRRTTIQSPATVRRTTPTAAQQAFLQHCKIRNLAPQTLVYYTENLRYFFQKVQVDYVDEISQAKFDDFLGAELDDNKKVTSLCTLGGKETTLRGCYTVGASGGPHGWGRGWTLSSR